ncbi:MAG: DNA-formamidopyrimidine glycosylase [Mycoplasmoidaceae bacterium]
MPELPEVQTLINSLNDEDIFNLEILDVKIFLPKIIKNVELDDFIRNVINTKIISIERIGKYLIFHLSNKKVILIHLRMEGKIFIINDLNCQNGKHTLLKLIFHNKLFCYNDTRRFGTFHLYNEDNYLSSKELVKIAIDPLNKNFNWSFLKKQFQNSNKHIKTVLLDQTKVSGIGNIYADEILFASGIHPLKKAKDLKENDYQNIAINSTIILQKAVENKGTTIFSYLYKKDAGGMFQKFLKVHMKKNQPCVNCKTLIKKIKVNGRGTYFCNKCQK